MKATARDLRFHSKEILESISRGEEVTITYRGKAHAKMIPLKNIEKSKSRGIISENERYNKVIDIWTHVRDLVKHHLMENLISAMLGANQVIQRDFYISEVDPPGSSTTCPHEPINMLNFHTRRTLHQQCTDCLVT